MNITDFYNEAPVLATVLTLAYAVVVLVFVCAHLSRRHAGPMVSIRPT